MKKIGIYFKDYDAFHRTTGNKVFHCLGIPMIMLSAFGMLDQVVLAQWNFPINLSLALVAWLFVNVFYLVLHVGLGLSMVVSTALMWFVAAQLSMPILVALQIAGWIFQGIGHAVYEKKAPAFLKNATHLMIGPIYIQNYLLGIYSKK